MAYIGFGESDSWFLFYALDLAAILAAAAAAPFIGVHGVVALCGVSGAAFAASLVANFPRFFIRGESALADLGPLFKLPGLSHGMVLYVDNVSYGFALLTALISCCVFFYAFSYMRFEKSIVNFLVFLKLFGWSMTLLVLSGS
jgi:NADH:ubiquinone oxidoreductase subunit 5 (subunit L)/multisubunit Na+/H+ antiporter MnhA subunit